jgi:hypothetical protein
MKYLKYIIAYLGFIIGNGIVIFELLILFKYFNLKLTFGDREFLFWFGIVPCFYLYHKYKPFKLTGDLDLKIKRFFNSYFESQKSCQNCDRVVKASELTPNGKCIYCKEDKK